ncbi:HAMP domain-containing histidine kinase [Paenibacillus sp. HN-1]|uniref:sensor histidine kinase n=1 Tax=Paenibacillus TaxID=44249 RepID=UPI001CA964CC|nr:MULTISPECIES: HAMP domain-containing sensor histidine kinase [Paenibacillus]MBY9078061.1 HAMP domain-containing histidine kinase [Paenibacillus sp. CGMCC 1.18879]MBY9083802.1 HAMP domain-containing histidine kinase [Paenibacillus sinensis]
MRKRWFTKRLPKWRFSEGKPQDNDVIRLTQRRLTIRYSAVLVGFLLLFIVTVYLLLHYLLMNQQKQQLNSWLEQQLYALHENWEHGQGRKSYLGDGSKQGGGSRAGVNEIAGFVADTSGNLLPLNPDSVTLVSQLANTLSDGWADTYTPEGEITGYWSLWLNDNETTAVSEQGSEGDLTAEVPGVTGKSKLLVAGRAIVDGGHVLGVIYGAKDITAQHRLFQWLLAVLAAVSVLFAGFAVFLSHKMSSKAMIPVKRSFARQREFVADASHELRTPLSVLMSSVDALEMEGVGEGEPFVRRVLDNMRDEAKRMIRLSDSLLTLARSDSGAAALRMENFDLGAVAERIADSFKPMALSKAITLRNERKGPIPFRGDSERLSQLLVILLDNAIKYTPDGGLVELSVFAMEAKVQKLVIEVRDNGIGIKPEDRERVFERFYREEKSRARELGGHGLGLSIAKWIVEAHGGTIEVTGSPGEGSIFRAELPNG